MSGESAFNLWSCLKSFTSSLRYVHSIDAIKKKRKCYLTNYKPWKNTHTSKLHERMPWSKVSVWGAPSLPPSQLSNRLIKTGPVVDSGCSQGCHHLRLMHEGGDYCRDGVWVNEMITKGTITVTRKDSLSSRSSGDETCNASVLIAQVNKPGCEQYHVLKWKAKPMYLSLKLQGFCFVCLTHLINSFAFK